MQRGSIVFIVVLAALCEAGCTEGAGLFAREGATTKPVAGGGEGVSMSKARPSAASMQKVQKGMSFEQVVLILGPPTSQQSQLTAHAFNPFALGNQAQVTRFYYEKVGRVIFAGPDYAGGGTEVIAVEEDPHESGWRSE